LPGGTEENHEHQVPWSSDRYLKHEPSENKAGVLRLQRSEWKRLSSKTQNHFLMMEGGKASETLTFDSELTLLVALKYLITFSSLKA
jgi:hypothetical protein